MSGPELQQELARRGSKLPIIFITARADPALLSLLIDRGARACFVKPFDEEELLGAVRAVAGLGSEGRLS